MQFPVPLQRKGEIKTVKSEEDKMTTNRPSIAVMINDAIATLNEKGGSSLHAIKKYIATTYKVDVQKLDSHLKRALKKGVESGSLTKPTGKGASGSFKLADKPKTTKKPAREKEQKARKEEVAAYPMEQKVVEEVKPNTARVNPKKARANKKAVGTDRASKPPAKKKAAASKKAPAAEVNSPTTVVPKVAKKEEVESSSDPDGFPKMLRIDVVMEELLKFFDIKGMKTLSRVSKDALIAVRNSKVFSDRVHFRISVDSIRSRVLDNCFYSWKSVRFAIPKSFDDEIINYIPDSSMISQSLGSVRSLSVELKYSLNNTNGFVLKIIESSKETLENLRLHIPVPDLKGIECIHIPNLKSLDLGRINGDLLHALLENLPPLEELTARVYRLAELVAGLQGRMSKLRKLAIAEDKFFGLRPCSRSAGNFNLNVAKGMTKLEDISITLHSHDDKRCVEDTEEILGYIPAESVTKVTVHERFPVKAPRRIVLNINKQICRFSHLTDLRLNSLENFDDGSLQSIIKACPKLKNLALICLAKLTDFGISGADRGVSLTELKDLATLDIQRCNSIALATFLNTTRFEFLTSLKYSVEIPRWQAITPRHFLLGILQQNPSLKSIDLGILRRESFVCSTRDSPLEDEVKALYPRIQQLKLEHNFALREPRLQVRGLWQ